MHSFLEIQTKQVLSIKTQGQIAREVIEYIEHSDIICFLQFLGMDRDALTMNEYKKDEFATLDEANRVWKSGCETFGPIFKASLGLSPGEYAERYVLTPLLGDGQCCLDSTTATFEWKLAIANP